MHFFTSLLSLCFISLLWTSGVSAKSTVFDLNELVDREIAAGARVSIKSSLSRSELQQRFRSCVPLESKPYTGIWDSSLDERVFTSKEVADLMKCDSQHCAFNFLPEEISQLAPAKSEADRIRLFKEFYQTRYLRKTGLAAERAEHLTKSSDNPFDSCKSSKLNQLIDNRPSADWPMRLGVAHYNPRMRPTTRLLQGDFFQADNGDLCFADVFIYSNHYDLDRLELWRLTEQAPGQWILELQIRHRIDLLNTWFRRLNKGALRDELRFLVEDQARQASTCLLAKP